MATLIGFRYPSQVHQHLRRFPRAHEQVYIFPDLQQSPRGNRQKASCNYTTCITMPLRYIMFHYVYKYKRSCVYAYMCSYIRPDWPAGLHVPSPLRLHVPSPLRQWARSAQGGEVLGGLALGQGVWRALRETWGFGKPQASQWCDRIFKKFSCELVKHLNIEF